MTLWEVNNVHFSFDHFEQKWINLFKHASCDYLKLFISPKGVTISQNFASNKIYIYCLFHFSTVDLFHSCIICPSKINSSVNPVLNHGITTINTFQKTINKVTSSRYYFTFTQRSYNVERQHSFHGFLSL